MLNCILIVHLYGCIYLVKLISGYIECIYDSEGVLNLFTSSPKELLQLPASLGYPAPTNEIRVYHLPPWISSRVTTNCWSTV